MKYSGAFLRFVIVCFALSSTLRAGDSREFRPAKLADSTWCTSVRSLPAGTEIRVRFKADAKISAEARKLIKTVAVSFGASETNKDARAVACYHERISTIGDVVSHKLKAAAFASVAISVFTADGEVHIPPSTIERDGNTTIATFGDNGWILEIKVIGPEF